LTKKVICVESGCSWNIGFDVGMHIDEAGRYDSIVSINRELGLGKEKAPATQTNYLVVTNANAA
jgi:hypothetical protein